MIKYAVPVILFIGFTASSCSTLLKATFESDAIGSPPAADLPGSPSGDIIEFNAAMTPQLKVQNSAISGDKALFYSNAAVSDPPPVTLKSPSIFRGPRVTC